MSNSIVPARTVIPGTDTPAAPLAAGAVPLDAGAHLDVTVRVRPGEAIPAYDPHVSRDEVEQRLASKPADLARVAQFAAANGLRVEETNANEHTVHVSGTAAQMERAFGVSLSAGAGVAQPHRERTGAISVPNDLDGVVTGVFGLDDTTIAQPQLLHAHGAPEATFTPPEVAAAYHFPAGDGSGEHIGVISLGGRYDDGIQAKYLASLGIKHVPWNVTKVDGGASDPSDAGPTGENMLDAEVIGSLVPAADKTMYIASNSDRGFLDAIAKAVHDPAHKNTAISISWGGPEEYFTGQARAAFDQIFAEARAMGINVFAASGDNGAGDGVGDGRSHVDFPAASPGVIAAGGTKLTTNADGSIAKETVWNELRNGEGAGGGGISKSEPPPAGQEKFRLDGRGVPDIAGNADPVTGYRVLEPDGRRAVSTVVGGTSAVAPLYAALAARVEQHLGHPIGDLQSALYAAPASTFHDVVEGTNGAYAAKKGWDAASGFGSIDGSALLHDLRATDRLA